MLKYPGMKSSKMALLVGILGFFCIAYAQTSTRIDAAFQKFWSAQSPEEAERYIDDVIKSGATFDEALQRLKAGRTYSAAKTGVVMLQNKTKDGIEHFSRRCFAPSPRLRSPLTMRPRSSTRRKTAG